MRQNGVNWNEARGTKYYTNLLLAYFNIDKIGRSCFIPFLLNWKRRMNEVYPGENGMNEVLVEIE